MAVLVGALIAHSMPRLLQLVAYSVAVHLDRVAGESRVVVRLPHHIVSPGTLAVAIVVAVFEVEIHCQAQTPGAHTEGAVGQRHLAVMVAHSVAAFAAVGIPDMLAVAVVQRKCTFAFDCPGKW